MKEIMASNVSGWNCYKEPVYEFYSDAFTFVMGIEFILEDKPSRKFDVYKCNSSEEFTIICSNEPGDYFSSISFGQLFAHFIIRHCGKDN